MEANLITLNQAGHDGDSASSTLPARMESLELNTAADRKEDVSSRNNVAQAPASPTLRGDGHDEQARNDTDGKGGNMKEQRAKKVSVEVKENDKDNKKKKSKSKSKKGGVRRARVSISIEVQLISPQRPNPPVSRSTLLTSRSRLMSTTRNEVCTTVVKRSLNAFRQPSIGTQLAVNSILSGS